ncbi:hypothetical protein HRD49_41155 [Corallococcus exiguus]|uniref:hypothetical protein n=1 Tax=Corallococcus TaxID=83461 RepID=UPI000EA09B04|nr:MULTISPECIES: hypothetical protein [Corallococcus]NNB92666.1 hypothetical protein [Corallococcus exiguus]NNC19272.1 hypothetical protein [Corallococcus exiguus]NPC45486.1 hypothetical protein [Corallococcus exiguus]NRD56553.1 hypothetical protein [Corallococcus exiguus]NRD68157.1 hypothetical protein [Corallococcus exiguus]
MSKLHQTLLTASVALLGLNGCGGTELPEPELATAQQGMQVAAAIPLPIPACAGALDTDGDGVCDLVETLLGTNPNNPDTDGDRLNDYAESFGFGGGLDLTALGANARKKDIFIEVDYYPGQQPTQAMLNRVITAFSKAPVSNPDGSTGITLHLVVDQQITAADADLDLSPVWTDFDVIKGKYFAANRAPYFHYMLFANRYGGGNSSGISRGIPAHDFVVTLGFAAGITELQLAGTLMHELGHNIGLRHGGNDDSNYKPNYLSIMNYEYQFYGFGIGGLNNVLDYSRVQVASFNEQSVNEVSGFAPVAPTTEADLAKISGLRFNDAQVTGNASTNTDFNNNGSIQAAAYVRDFNRNGFADVFPASQNDWTALAYDGGGQIGFATSGLTQDLGREELFLVAPEKMEPCLTVDARDAR